MGIPIVRLWDKENKKWVSVPAIRGEDGRGVSGIGYDAETGLWTIHYTDGTSETINGPQPGDEIAGPPGDDGVGIENIAYKETTDEGNAYTITLTDGNTYDFVAPVGQDGNDGKDGQDGKTPVKGEDYFTEEDKREIAEQTAGLVEVPEGFSGSYNDLTDVPTSFNPTDHTHGAAKITMGTFAGAVMANNAGQTYSSYLLRNTRLAAEDTTPTINGQICWTYE